MKIGFIEPHLKCVGGIRRIIEVSNRLMRRGHDVKIFSGFKTYCSWMPNAVPVFELSKLKEHEFDIVIFNLADQYREALRARTKRTVFWVLAPEAYYKEPSTPVLAIRQPFYFMANSNYVVSYIKHYRKVNHTIPVIPGGINPEHFRHDPTIPKKFDVVYYGSSRPWKGTRIIEQALATMRAKVLKMEGLNTPQDKMYTLYNQARVCVSANLAEGFSYLQLEAMACGCAVVTTDDGGSRDYIKPNINAVVAPRNPVALANAVKSILDNKRLHGALVSNGLMTAHEARFNWDNVTTQVEQALTRFLEAPL